ncbi:MAG: protein kinase [Anaerolineales bacterium]|nr:protein kinase [Anaerolineales bacterium]
MPEWIGQTIGKVRVDKYLARGGMAEVYLGTHLSLDRPVAIKVLHSFIESDPELLDRFQREAKAVAGLRHPNIVQVFDFDAHENHPYIVMEYLKGPTLSTYLQSLHNNGIKLSLEQIGQLLRSLVAGLDYAHSHGVIHRDIKPANILLHNKTGDFTENSMITKHVEPVITDFGLARIVNSGKQTASGLVSGTPSYMSPEQARGTKVDHRTDIYSIGVILYELVSGRVPFEGDTAITVIFKHINEAPPPIEGIPEELQNVIDKALTKYPEDRYNSGHDLMVGYFQAIGIRLESETIHLAPTRAPRSASVSRKKKSKLNPIWIGAGIFACACVSIMSLSVLGFSVYTFFPTIRTTQPNTSPMATEHAETTHVPEIIPSIGDDSVGLLRFQDGSAIADQITVSANLDTPPEGTQYEVWLIENSGEQSRSIGILANDGNGVYSLTYVDPQSRNLLADYDHMEITVEPSPDNSPNPSGQVAYSSGIPRQAVAHIRHLMVSTEESPNQIGMIDGIRINATLIDQSGEAMLAAYESGNQIDVRSNAEALVNLIVGNQDSAYVDWDSNGTVNNPGDGYGMLLNGEQAGYIEGVHHHSSYSADTEDATPNIRLHDAHVEVSIQNIEKWTIELRDTAKRILQAPEGANIEADVRTAVTLADQILNGLDIDGNESVDPIPGEGGANTAYQHAYYMADMPILPGEDQMPATGR